MRPAHRTPAHPLFLRVARTLGPLPEPRTGAAAAALGSNLVVSGGLSSDGGASTSTVFIISSRGQATSSSPLPGPVHDAAAAAVDGRLLVFGGGEFEGTNRVIQVFPGPPRMVAALPQPLSDLAAVSIKHTIYVVGGWNGSAPNRDIYAVSAAGTTNSVGVLPVGVRYPAAGALDEQLIVAGGETADGKPTASAWQFNPTTRRLTRVPNLPAPTDHTAGAVMAGQFCILGGLRNGVFTRAILCWAPGELRWRSAGSLPQPLSDLDAVSFDGGIAVIGGRGSSGATATASLLLPS